MSAPSHPTEPGFYWAKLVTPTRMPAGEDWVSLDWETVELFANNGRGDEAYGVFVPGIVVVQRPKDSSGARGFLDPSEVEARR